MKNAIVISLILFSNLCLARLPDELVPKGIENRTQRSNTTSSEPTDPSFLLDIQSVKCMPVAQSTNNLLEYSFFLGPDVRPIILDMIQYLKSNKQQMSAMDENTRWAHTTAARSLTPEGREFIKTIATQHCKSDQILKQDIELNEIALKILKSFVETPLTGR